MFDQYRKALQMLQQHLRNPKAKADSALKALGNVQKQISSSHTKLQQAAQEEAHMRTSDMADVRLDQLPAVRSTGMGEWPERLALAILT